jgi:ankyrin repeat protein
VAVLRLFLAEGADVAAIDKRGSSPLLIAIIVGHDGAARALLDAGADRVRLLREEGRDVSSQYGREGEGRGGGGRVKAGALAMGQHPRLGADSGARAVDPGVLRRILARLWQARASHLVVKF